MTHSEYLEKLRELPDALAKLALERAWQCRDFEIELYWKRATYFWAFIASTFVGYVALITSDWYEKIDNAQHVEVYLLICTGFVESVAWHLSNLGSKGWQRNWEAHIDLLEDRFTGPIYKTVALTRTYSVSKINEIVSATVCLVWLLLGAKYLATNDLIRVWVPGAEINWFVAIGTVATVLAVVAMIFGHGRGRFSGVEVQMYKRDVWYKNSEGTSV